MQDDQVTDDNVVMVDKPEKWTEADSIIKEVEIQTIEGPASFKLKALSSAAHSKIISTLDPLKPEPPIVENLRGVPSQNLEDKNYQLANAEFIFKRMVLFIDHCWMELPGDSLDLKSQWASENLWHRDELRQLYQAIIDVSGFAEPVKRSGTTKPVIINDPTTWASMSKRPVEIVMARKIAFKINPISRAHSQHIELACPAPEAPMIPAPGKSSKVRQFVKNERDPKYLAQVESIEEKRIVLVLEHSLEWKIPGETFEEKSDWLRKRPAGEVTMLYRYILRTVNGFQSRSDFM